MCHKYEIDGVDALSMKEVADQFVAPKLDRDERIGDIRLECGCDLEVDIHIKDETDPRIDGHLDRTETLTLSDIRELSEGDVYFWAKDCESGEWVLLCRN